MRIDFEITYRGETVNLDETSSQMVVSFTLYDGNFPNGGSGAVSSVNGKTGAVVLDASDIAETSTLKWLTSTLKGYYDTAYNWVNTNGSSVLQSISDLQTAIGNRYTKSETDNLLNNKVDKVSGKGLSENDLTNALKSSYDSAVADKHTHVNKSTLDLIEQPLTTALKTTYDGYGLQISGKANIADVQTMLYRSEVSTSTTSVDFTFPAGYKYFEVKCINLISVTDNVGMWVRVSTNGGATFKDGASDYMYQRLIKNGISDATSVSSPDSKIIFLGGNISNGATGRYFNAIVKIFDPLNSSRHKNITGEFNCFRSDSIYTLGLVNGSYVDNTPINAVRIMMSSGSIASGIFELWGHK